jgi:hypothetical protein
VKAAIADLEKRITSLQSKLQKKSVSEASGTKLKAKTQTGE